MKILWVEYCLSGNYIRLNFMDWSNPGGNFLGGNYRGWGFPGWELSGWELSWVGIFLDGNFPDGDCLVGIVRVAIFRVGVFLVPRLLFKNTFLKLAQTRSSQFLNELKLHLSKMKTNFN